MAQAIRADSLLTRVTSDFVAALTRDRFEAKKTLDASEGQYHWFIGYFVGLNHHAQLAHKTTGAAPGFDVTAVSSSVTFDALREMVDKCQAWFELKQWPRLQLVMRAFKELVSGVDQARDSTDAIFRSPTCSACTRAATRSSSAQHAS